MRTGQLSIGTTLFFSFVYGFASFSLVINRISPDEVYQHDAFSTLLLAPLGSFFGFIVASFVHELAHFFMARVLGGYVRKIQIGSGSLLGSFRIMGTRCDVHETLRSGAVWHFLTSSKNARLKLAAITAAAPLASIALAGILISLLVFIHPLTFPPFSFWYYFFPFLVGFTLPSVAFLPGVLLPYSYKFAGRTVESDGLRLLRIPQMSDEKIAAMTRAGQEAITFSEELDFETTTLDEALSKAKIAPTNALALSTAINFLRVEHDSRALDYFQKLISLPLTPTNRNMFVDQYITCCLEWNAVSSRPQEMDELSLALIESNPANISIMGTRASVLVDLARIDEGSAMLKEVLEKTDSTIDKTYANIFLALAEKRRGNLAQAREHAEKAAKFDPACPALQRVADLLPPSAGASVSDPSTGSG